MDGTITTLHAGTAGASLEAGMHSLQTDASKEASGKQPFDKDQARMSLIIIRTDLTHAQQMVQACHAASMAGYRFAGWDDETRMALLAARDLDQLAQAADRLRKAGIEFHEFFEPDHGIGISAIATAPIAWKQATRALRHLPLWEGQSNDKAA